MAYSVELREFLVDIGRGIGVQRLQCQQLGFGIELLFRMSCAPHETPWSSHLGAAGNRS